MSHSFIALGIRRMDPKPPFYFNEIQAPNGLFERGSQSYEQGLYFIAYLIFKKSIIYIIK